MIFYYFFKTVLNTTSLLNLHNQASLRFIGINEAESYNVHKVNASKQRIKGRKSGE